MVSSALAKLVTHRAGGRCECRLAVCGHHGRCSASLPEEPTGAVVCIAITREDDDLGNWLALCPDCQGVWLSSAVALRDANRSPVPVAAG